MQNQISKTYNKKEVIIQNIGKGTITLCLSNKEKIVSYHLHHNGFFSLPVEEAEKLVKHHPNRVRITDVGFNVPSWDNVQENTLIVNKPSEPTNEDIIAQKVQAALEKHLAQYDLTPKSSSSKKVKKDDSKENEDIKGNENFIAEKDEQKSENGQ